MKIRLSYERLSNRIRYSFKNSDGKNRRIDFKILFDDFGIGTHAAWVIGAIKDFCDLKKISSEDGKGFSFGIRLKENKLEIFTPY